MLNKRLYNNNICIRDNVVADAVAVERLDNEGELDNFMSVATVVVIAPAVDNVANLVVAVVTPVAAAVVLAAVLNGANVDAYALVSRAGSNASRL